MNHRRPENLELLSEAFGGQEIIESIFTGESLEVDGVEFVSGYVADSSAERFYIVKPMHLIDRYRDLAAFAAGGRIVELGIAEGGSAALLCLWADPATLVTVDNEPSPLTALDEFADAHGFVGRLRPFYGVDQADRDRLAEIMDAEFGADAIDLVIDDASHSYWPTRASFETLFPRVRPGGRYIIEDWEADIAMADSVRIALQDPTSPHHERARKGLAKAMGRPPQPATRVSMSRLILELVILAGGQSGAIADVSINKSFVSITRGESPLDLHGFRLDDHGVHGHRLLVERPAE
ncbi:MAG: hypothetical protein DHS20C19_10460 [Acidimicrobiales bacterium]|nr:MAG: hypothetical protein DHS20C19_10460 [Acidimicrobiales bacterium]